MLDILTQLQVLQAMRFHRLPLNVYHCSSVVSAYEKAQTMRQSCHLVRVMIRFILLQTILNLYIFSWSIIFYHFHGYHGDQNICNRNVLIVLLGLWQLAIRPVTRSAIQSLEFRWTIGRLHYECPLTTRLFFQPFINTKASRTRSCSYMVCDIGDCSFLGSICADTNGLFLCHAT